MTSDILEQFRGSPRYSRLEQDGTVEECCEKGVVHHKRSSQRPWYCYPLLSGLCVILAGVAGYILGTRKCHGPHEVAHLAGTVFQVPIGTSRQIFQYNSSFAAPPPKNGGSEPVWDSMIPNGLGYVRDADTAMNTSVISAFHNLHCLYTIRRAYYSTSEGDLEDFDFGKERKPHVAHCFDYLRQGISCSADSTIEPAVDTVNGFLGAGFPRQCRDFGELQDWAKDHRVFDAHGFLADMEHG
ncbi:hypothetical protein N7G274_009690 [Stereocaulon virgatum]|uniref:Uncharacterized protein n=1 Tax=Stereocaulon virgatum TaxID=373712 RepID=A0ABR3ZZR3_9LECA